MQKRIHAGPIMQKPRKTYPPVPIAAKQGFLIGCVHLAATMGLEQLKHLGLENVLKHLCLEGVSCAA